jgi:serine phosphatase RsbU (regulator of sigma subunit)/Tfp pilus assembly protein PilF
MKIKPLFILAFALIVLCATSHAQRVIDSLQLVLKAAKADTARVNIMHELAIAYESSGDRVKSMDISTKALELAKRSGYQQGEAVISLRIGYLYLVEADYPKALDWLDKARKLGEDAGDKKTLGKVYRNKGTIYIRQGNYPEALDHYLKSLTYSKEAGDKKGIADSYNNIGIVNEEQGNYPEALQHYFKSLQIREELGDKKGVSSSFNNIGVIYRNQNNYTKALEYYFKSVEECKALGDVMGVAETYSNIGACYSDSGAYREALEYHHKSVKTKTEMEDKRGLEISYYNIGVIYAELQEFSVKGIGKKGAKLPVPPIPGSYLDSAYYYFGCSRRIAEELNDSYGIMLNLHALSNTLKIQGKHEEALELSKKVAALAQSMGVKEIASANYFQMSKILAELGRYKEAYDAQVLHFAMKDSLLNENKQKEIGRIEAGFEYEKQLLQKQKEQEKKDAVAAEAIKRQKLITWSFASGGSLVFLLALVVYRGYRQKQKANKELDLRNKKIGLAYQIIEEKNKDITASIHYAKRIQRAVLPSDVFLDKHLPDHFVFFKPKDIVSGDFYWATQAGDAVLVATADCTGHGVPGAFMSLIGSAFLSEIVVEKGITRPDLVLNALRENIIRALNPEGTSVEAKDGMDIVLCRYDMKRMVLEFAAANNPVWIVRGGTAVEEHAPDKFPVGKYAGKEAPFTLRTVQLNKGDIVYTFTDGFADQFGGEKGKKFKYKPLQALLLANCNLPMDEQRDKLSSTLESWKGNLEQVDDVLLIGVRV